MENNNTTKGETKMNENKNEQNDSAEESKRKILSIGGRVQNWTDAVEPDEDGHILGWSFENGILMSQEVSDIRVDILPERISKADALIILRKIASKIEKEWHEMVVNKMQDLIEADEPWQSAGFIKRRN